MINHNIRDDEPYEYIWEEGKVKKPERKPIKGTWNRLADAVTNIDDDKYMFDDYGYRFFGVKPEGRLGSLANNEPFAGKSENVVDGEFKYKPDPNVTREEDEEVQPQKVFSRSNLRDLLLYIYKNARNWIDSPHKSDKYVLAKVLQNNPERNKRHDIESDSHDLDEMWSISNDDLSRFLDEGVDDLYDAMYNDDGDFDPEQTDGTTEVLRKYFTEVSDEDLKRKWLT